jgi:hypothetical protein
MRFTRIAKEALDGAIAGMEGGMPETLAQLDELLVTLGARVGRNGRSRTRISQSKTRNCWHGTE